MNDKPSASIFQLAVIVSVRFLSPYMISCYLLLSENSSLAAIIGLTESQVLTDGEFLLSPVMVGMLTGGILFGILGDKLGRLRVLLDPSYYIFLANI
ncbi:MAG: MFS transporter, partial [Saprospiraceae bacterium]|nr:MFS transporter [Saprospiraceae bacterium]